MYISAGGGWREEGKLVGEIDMAADYERLANRDYTGRQVRRKMSCMLNRAKARDSFYYFHFPSAYCAKLVTLSTIFLRLI